MQNFRSLGLIVLACIEDIQTYIQMGWETFKVSFDIIHPSFFGVLNNIYFMDFFDWRIPYALNCEFSQGVYNRPPLGKGDLQGQF